MLFFRDIFAIVTILSTTSCLSEEFFARFIRPMEMIKFVIINDTDTDYILKIDDSGMEQVKPTHSRKIYKNINSKGEVVLVDEFFEHRGKDGIDHESFLYYLYSEETCQYYCAEYTLMDKDSVRIKTFNHKDGSKFSELFFDEANWEMELTRLKGNDKMVTMTFRLTPEIVGLE